MLWFVVAQVFTLMLDVFAPHRQSEHEKDLTILLLRQQLEIMERKQSQPSCLPAGKSLQRFSHGLIQEPESTGGKMTAHLMN